MIGNHGFLKAIDQLAWHKDIATCASDKQDGNDAAPAKVVEKHDFSALKEMPSFHSGETRPKHIGLISEENALTTKRRRTKLLKSERLSLSDSPPLQSVEDDDPEGSEGHIEDTVDSARSQPLKSKSTIVFPYPQIVPLKEDDARHRSQSDLVHPAETLSPPLNPSPRSGMHKTLPPPAPPVDPSPHSGMHETLPPSVQIVETKSLPTIEPMTIQIKPKRRDRVGEIAPVKQVTMPAGKDDRTEWRRTQMSSTDSPASSSLMPSIETIPAERVHELV